MYCTAVAGISCGYARLVDFFDAFLAGALALYAKYELASAAKSQRKQKLVVFGTGAILLIYALLKARSSTETRTTASPSLAYLGSRSVFSGPMATVVQVESGYFFNTAAIWSSVTDSTVSRSSLTER